MQSAQDDMRLDDKSQSGLESNSLMIDFVVADRVSAALISDITQFNEVGVYRLWIRIE